MAETDITKLYRQHATMLRHSCRRILGDAQLAEDVTQESFMEYIKYASRHVVDEPGAVLYRIATRLSVKRLRKRKLDVQMNEHITADTRTGPPEHRIAILKILDTVEEEEAQIAVMHFVEGLSHEEICELMDVSRRTIGHRLEKFCRRAAKLLAIPGKEAPEPQEAYEFVAGHLGKGA